MQKKNSCKRNAKLEKEIVTDGSKLLKLNVLSNNTTTVAAPETEQDDDCFITKNSNKKRDLNEDNMARHTKFLDNAILSLSLVKKNVLPINSKLNDESLDLFLHIVRDFLL